MAEFPDTCRNGRQGVISPNPFLFMGYDVLSLYFHDAQLDVPPPSPGWMNAFPTVVPKAHEKLARPCKGLSYLQDCFVVLLVAADSV